MEFIECIRKLTRLILNFGIDGYLGQRPKPTAEQLQLKNTSITNTIDPVFLNLFIYDIMLDILLHLDLEEHYF